MISQRRAAKSRSILLKVALSLSVLSGLCLPTEAPAVDLQVAAQTADAGRVAVSDLLIAAGGSTGNLRAIATSEEILAELNRVRQSPAEYAAWLETLRPYYEGNDFRFPGEPGIRTSEGVAALDTAINLLEARSPMPPLRLEPGLVLSTQGHLDELLSHNRFTLSGLDGSTPAERAERYGSLEGGQLIELLSEPYASAPAIVAALIIDDGNRGRSTQKVLLNSGITSVGAVCGAREAAPLCVFSYASNYFNADYFNADYFNAETMLTASAPEDTSASPTVRSGSTEDPTWFGEIADEHLTALSAELVAETNKMRANPAAYARRLEAIRDHYEGNLVKVPGRPPVQVVEGVAALDEAIAVLRGSQPLGALAFSPGMSFGANDHAADLGEQSATGHYGSDGSDPFERINRYGLWRQSASENISYGQATIAEWHLINLLVDDNVPDRGHRKALLEPSYSAMGAACQEHPGFRIVCVMNYASEYYEDN